MTWSHADPTPETSPEGSARFMSAPDTKSILARIVAAHKGAGPGHANLLTGLQQGFSRAIRRASLPFAALAPQIAEVVVSPDASLRDAVDALPEHGLVAAIEDEDGRRGLVALAHPLVDALIEVQTTGHVEDTDLAPRKVTRIDEALCRDFLDLLFGAFAQETAQTPGRDWPDRVHYGSIVMDRGQLNLLLPEQGYHLLRTSVTAAGRKTGDIVMLLPSDAALARRHAAKSGADKQAAPVDWSADMLRVLGAAPIVLDAVLMRVVMPLGKVEALGVGDLVPFDHADLGRVQLEGEGGHVFAKGALGQLGGKRAFRLTTDAGARKAPPGPTAGATPAMSSGAGPAANPASVGLPEPSAPAPPDALPALAGGFDPGAPMSGLNDGVQISGFDPDAPMGGFDPDAPIA